MFIDRRMDKEDVVYIYNGILAIKKNKILPFLATWMDLENIMFNEISQAEKDKYCMISLICGIYKIIQTNVYSETETDSYT